MATERQIDEALQFIRASGLRTEAEALQERARCYQHGAYVIDYTLRRLESEPKEWEGWDSIVPKLKAERERLRGEQARAEGKALEHLNEAQSILLGFDGSEWPELIH